MLNLEQFISKLAKPLQLDQFSNLNAFVFYAASTSKWDMSMTKR